MSLRNSFPHRTTIFLLMWSLAYAAPVRITAQTYRPYQVLPKECKERIDVELTRDPKVRILKPGSLLICRLNEELSSKKVDRGEPLVAYVSMAIADENGVLLVPRNSQVIGQIDRVHPARAGKPAMLEIGFNTLRRCIFPNNMLPNTNRSRNDTGCSYDQLQLGGIMVPLTKEYCEGFTDEEPAVTGKSRSKKETLKYVGAGAGGGALLASIAAGTLAGAAIGAGVGAGVGLVIALTNRGKEVKIEAGALFGVELTHALPLRSIEQELTYPKPKPAPKPRPPGPSRPPNQGGGGGSNQTELRVAQIRGMLNTLIEEHTYDLGNRAQNSHFLGSLRRVDDSLIAYSRAQTAAQRSTILNRLYFRLNGVEEAINHDRIVNRHTISPGKVEYWNDIERRIKDLSMDR